MPQGTSKSNKASAQKWWWSR